MHCYYFKGAIGLNGSAIILGQSLVQPGITNVTCLGTESSIHNCVHDVLNSTSQYRCDTASVVCQGCVSPLHDIYHHYHR